MEKCVPPPQNGSGTTGHSQAKLKEGLDINLHPSQKFTETDHRTKCKTQTMKLLEDNLREDLDDSDLASDFLDTIQ